MAEMLIRNAIIQRLRETEETNSVRIPLAIESGSRGWGFASPDSDYDCRFVYVHEKEWYLTVLDKPDIIEYAADKVFDVNGWDLRKFIFHILKSNAVMFEWLSSNMIYIHNAAIVSLMCELAEKFFNPIAVSYHYLSLAHKKYKEIIDTDNAKLKKYFYVLRPLANLAYVEQHRKQPHMDYFRTMAEIHIDKTVADEIANLAELKKTSDESLVIQKNTVIIDYFSTEIGRYKENLKSMTFKKNRDYEYADTVFRKIIEMVWNDG